MIKAILMLFKKCIHNDIYRTVQKAIFKGEKANYTAGLIEC